MERDSALPVGQILGEKLCLDGLLENLPDIIRSDIEVFLHPGNGGIFLLLHLLVNLAEVEEGELALVAVAVLAHLPEGKGGDGVDASVRSGVVGDVLAHFDHGQFLEFAYFPASADPHDQVLGLYDRHEVYLALQH